MSDFSKFKRAVDEQMSRMVRGDLFTTDISSSVLYDIYLESFPPGTNLLYKERTEHDCNCCKQFIRSCGNVVAIVGGKKVSIWDVDVGGHYQVVADALSKAVKAASIGNVYFHYQRALGTDSNIQLLDSGSTLVWDHFYFKLPSALVKGVEEIPSILGRHRGSKNVFKRGLEELSVGALEIVLELIDQNSLYRGKEHEVAVKAFLEQKKAFDRIRTTEAKDNFCWQVTRQTPAVSGFKNTVIGTLVDDLSKDVGLEDAVKMFEAKMGGYKRTTAIATKGMIERAKQDVASLGLTSALERRHATIDDISVNNVLFVDRAVKQELDIFDTLAKNAPMKQKTFSKVEEVGIEAFITDILPSASTVEVQLGNHHTANLVSVLAPLHSDAGSLFKWGNNFSWAYNGEVADSMRTLVKKAGGDVEGALRFSIKWNDGDDNQNDFDAHCIEPNKNRIYYGSKGPHPSSAKLDVDIQRPGSKVAVENITWSVESKIQEGVHTFLVHNYSNNGGKTGFSAEVEYNGEIYSFNYTNGLRQGEEVVVAKAIFNREAGVKFVESLPNTHATKQVWGINTNQFHTVDVIMNSPNHWDGESTGNKHWFFVLDGCKNDVPARGFFNEFLRGELTQHRKTFELLGGAMKAEVAEEQLSGVGFSETQRNSILCRVTGSFTRIIKINF